MSQWIKTEDNLPSNCRAVLVWVKEQENELSEGTYGVAYCDTETEEWKEWLTDESLDYLGYEVVAWQELNDDYKEK